MKLNTAHGILLGLGVLGATTLVGTTQSAQAAPERVVTRTTTTRTVQVQPIQWRNDRNRPGRNRPGRRPYRPQTLNQTIFGRVVRDTPGNDFELLTDNGRRVRVYATRGESGRLSRNDRVQVTGYYSGGTFRANRVTILRNR